MIYFNAYFFEASGKNKIIKSYYSGKKNLDLKEKSIFIYTTLKYIIFCNLIVLIKAKNYNIAKVL